MAGTPIPMIMTQAHIAIHQLGLTELIVLYWVLMDNNIGISSVGFGISLMAVKTADNNGSINQVWDGVYYSIVSGADM